MPTGTDLDAAAAMAGGHCWLERRLFEATGSWVATSCGLDAKLMFDRHSAHHAWRASQWWDRLPVLADVDRDTLIVAPSDGWRAAAAALDDLADDVSRLAVAYRVLLPRLAMRYRTHVRSASPVSDSSALRTLRIVTADVAADWAEGEEVLQDLLDSEGPQGVERARAAATTVETRFISSSA